MYTTIAPRPIIFPKTRALALPRRRTALRHDATNPGTEAVAPTPASDTTQQERERAWSQREDALAAREYAIGDAEARQAERERDLAELEALLIAKGKLLLARSVPMDESAELAQLRAEIERQEASLTEAKKALKEREAFMDASEARLLEKVQAQQEQETELAQREEDLQARLEAFERRQPGSADPEMADVPREEAGKSLVYDEFRE
jgi:hypothetical protein